MLLIIVLLTTSCLAEWVPGLSPLLLASLEMVGVGSVTGCLGLADGLEPCANKVTSSSDLNRYEWSSSLKVSGAWTTCSSGVICVRSEKLIEVLSMEKVFL
ncbi:unnamed protein product [Moneuplotes crassus]|uniref:Uncharacterized protein n=1 Tax=Euplotes crassus TaxID=5936 RepID=A0AAD2D691_EUPCR|nr:unnamed protein product [Moneuplotes crassus]